MTRASLHHTMNHRDLLDLITSSHQRCSVKKKMFLKISQVSQENTCVGVSFKEHLRKTASIYFTSKYCHKQWWRVWTRRDLDRVQSKYFLNVTILFDQLQPNNLYVSSKNFQSFYSARFLNSNLHLVSQVATMSLRNRPA